MNALDYVRSSVEYSGVGGWAVRDLKFRRAIPLAARMAVFMHPLLDKIPPFDAVVPVPIHWSREAGRGFNQSLLIAKHLGLHPVRPELLTRVKRTRPQAQLSAKQRAQNLSDAFRAGCVSNMRLLLVDDVVTSGATLEACAQELKRARASWVGALTFAREISKNDQPSR
jgi:ComF family protein